jgi:hypothetical protein
MAVALIISIIWLIILSVSVYSMEKHYNNLLKDQKVTNLRGILDEILKNQDLSKREILKLKEILDNLEKESDKFIQRIGIAQFNPFNETGGQQSFALSVLNNMRDGFILTALHSRDRTRIYIKRVYAGKSNLDLSNEEKKALKDAITKTQNI